MKESKTITEKIKELEEKANWFSSDEFELDQAKEKYDEAIKLAKELQKDLTELKNEIEVLSEDFSK